jgi:hypothetical protein
MRLAYSYSISVEIGGTGPHSRNECAKRGRKCQSSGRTVSPAISNAGLSNAFAIARTV